MATDNTALYNSFMNDSLENLQGVLAKYQEADAFGVKPGDQYYSEIKAQYDNYGKVLRDAIAAKGGGSGSGSGILQPTNTTTNTPTVDTAGMQNVQSSVDTGFTGVNESLDTGFAGVGNQITALGDQTKGSIYSLQNVTSEGFTNVGDSLTSLSDNQTTGFKNLGDSVANLSTAQTEGFTGVNQGITDLSTAMGDNFDEVDTAVSEGFNSVDTLLKEKFNLTDDQITKLSQDVLGGQTTLQEALTNLASKTDTYYGGLAEGQANIQADVGGVQTGLDQFQQDYAQDTAAATQARADLMSNVTGGFAAASDERDNIANVTGKDLFNIQNQIAQANQAAAQANQATQNTMSDIARNLAMNVGASTPEGVQAQNTYLSKLGKIKQLVGDSSFASSSDPKLYNAYLEVSQAFDNNGKLVPTTNMMNGTESRALDADGNLVVANFDTVGTRTAQNVFDLNQIFSGVTV